MSAYDEDDLEKAWRRAQARNNRRHLVSKGGTSSPDITKESSDCSSEDDDSASLDEIIELDAETALQSISFEEGEATTGEEETDEEETDEEDEEEEGEDEVRVREAKKFSLDCEKTVAYAPVGSPGFCGFAEWLYVNDMTVQ